MRFFGVSPYEEGSDEELEYDEEPYEKNSEEEMSNETPEKEKP